MTDDLQQAREAAAAQAMSDGYVTSGRQVLSWVELAEVALATADTHLPSVEQIAEVLDAHLIDRAIKFDSDGFRDWTCRCGNKATTDKPHHIHRAEAVRALFGEVAGDE